MRNICSAFIFLLTLNVCLGQEGRFSDKGLDLLESRLDSIINLGIDSLAFPGAQILVRHKDSIIFHKTWGYHTYDQIDAVALGDLYDLASVTKVSTGLPILMKLYGEGKLNLDAPIKEYFHSLKRSNKKDLTLRNILTHQARLHPYIVFWQGARKKNGLYKNRSFKTTASKRFNVKITDSLYLHRKYRNKMKKAIKKSKLRSEKKFTYSGLAFLLMPEMIADLVEEDFESYLSDQIFRPIGADNLYYNPLEKGVDLSSIVPTEYDSLWRMQLVHGTVHDEAAAMLGGVSCNAGLFGDAKSLSRLLQLYLNKGSWEGKQIISSEAVETFTSYQYKGNRRGLGFDKPLLEYDAQRAYVAKSASSESFGHSGFTGTFVWVDPKYDLVFVFLSNRVYPSREHRNLYKLSLRPAMHQIVYDYILTEK